MEWLTHFTAGYSASSLDLVETRCRRPGPVLCGWARLAGRERGPCTPGGLTALGDGLATSCL